MAILKKKANHQSEEEFHDQWALSVPIDELDVYGQFQGKTSPEYKIAAEMLGPVKGKKVLILGCGLGEEAVYLATQGANVIAIDISKQMLNKTKELAKKYHVEKKIVYKQMSVEKLDFPNNSIDHMFGCNILHHVDLAPTVKEIKRVLKKGGVAVFSEPLAYNPVINVYRAMASTVRTDHEHPLKRHDLALIEKYFPKTTHIEFHLTTLLIFVWFYLGERVHPNKSRYWKKIITEADKYKSAFNVLYNLDTGILRVIPPLKWYCWVTVIKVEK